MYMAQLERFSFLKLRDCTTVPVVLGQSHKRNVSKIHGYYLILGIPILSFTIGIHCAQYPRPSYEYTPLGDKEIRVSVVTDILVVSPLYIPQHIPHLTFLSKHELELPLI